MDISYIYMRIDDYLTTHAYGNLSSRNRISVEVLEAWVPGIEWGCKYWSQIRFLHEKKKTLECAK